ncbi:dynamin family protein [Cellulomonas fimi]|uniref:GTP-binding protein HSR1-related protein n=1 Tax=Cellulomonas fimi (strain ATCC 484 / DSM 20113 / JCM 1341 / CCUG 24087 / LMG 16345 / NBRC 15513 / NCIMB 8980 / NCTC 7547 / NRS-133) TaxID=590998 RepID=F4H5S1_CELFA|nr:dynamin family protein [Cellulomonas fimi]AEE45521.1 GTP-binding protein HSR1-related protein [Cellulomonas fimi ATCC 484]NNH05967.1 GTP-binding protein HSR1 [Cellulomonas fimi]VEH29709.1 GTPase Era [Cellulomonas fimi]
MSAAARGGPADRVAALADAVRLAAGRVDAGVEAQAADVVARAGERLALSGEYTVVALAGATGSGKSSLMNALVGAEVARPGVMRPTTGRPLAVVLPPPAPASQAVDTPAPRRGVEAPAGRDTSGPGDLLDWLDVSDRHVVAGVAAAPARRRRRAAAPVADVGGPPDLPTGAVLLDLPDHDSVVAEHRAVAERLYARADLLVWVVDPQKYADAALHVRYLRPLAGHSAVLVLALNQVDRLSPREVQAVVADVRRVAAQDGLRDVPVLPVSAATGEGVGALRAHLAEAARRRQAATARVLADVRAAGAALRDACGAAPPPGAPERGVPALVDALEVAAGVPLVVDATRRSTLHQARAVTGWPVTRWVGRLRADPLRRLGLGRPAALDRMRGSSRRPDAPSVTADEQAARRSSLPRPATTAGALVSIAVRDYLDAATTGAPDAWTLAARSAVDRAALPDALDQAVVASAPAGERDPRWWRAVGVVQWALLSVAVAGGLWLGVLAALAYLRLPEPVTPTWGEVPWPTVLALGGLALGVLLALVARVLAGIGARRRAGRVRRRLRSGVRDVAERLVVRPATEELTAWSACRAAAERAAA